MSINPEIVGRVYPSENTYVVGRERSENLPEQFTQKTPSTTT